MKVEKPSAAHMPFKDHFKKQQTSKLQKKTLKKKKDVEKSTDKKDSHFIGWA
jgi:hypothetical protein